MKKKFKMSASMLGSIKSAEESLAKNERDNVVAEISDEERAKFEKDFGKLEDLPDGHPVLMNLLEAKRRHQNEEKDDAVKEKPVKKKKKTNRQKVKEANESFDKKAIVVKKFNKRLEEMRKSLMEFDGFIAEVGGELLDIPSAGVRITKIQRLTMAYSRGIAESKISSAKLY